MINTNKETFKFNTKIISLSKGNIIKSSKRLFCFVLILLILESFLACGDSAPPAADATPSRPAETSPDPLTDHHIDTTSVQSVQTLTTVDRTATPYNGRFVTATGWRDRLGDHILVVSEKGSYADGHGRKELFGYHYTQRDTLYDLLWQMNDYVDGAGCDLNVELIRYLPIVSDVDRNGIAETALFYALDNRCDASAYPAKLIVHEGRSKLAVRGLRAQYLNPPEAILNRYLAEEGLPPLRYKTLDAAAAAMDTTITSHYARRWDDFVRLENEVQGNLPDRMVRSF